MNNKIALEIPLINRLQDLLINRNQQICIVVHTNPDGDAIGSALGLHTFLKGIGFTKVDVIAPNAYASFLHWMPGNDIVINASEHQEVAWKIISGADLLFCLDFNGLSRAENLEQELINTKATKIMIDHHPEPEGGCELVFSDTAVSSTAELVYELIAALGYEDAIGLESAECLYAGIVTDTGSFSYACNNPRTYEITARLIEKGVDGARIQRLIYNNYTVQRMRLLGYCLSEKLVVLEEQHTAYISLTMDEMRRFEHNEGDTEGIVNYALSIGGVNMAALFIEKDDHIKLSLRSTRDQVDVNQFARAYFNGGGHKNAAGGKSFSDMYNTLSQFEVLVRRESF
jgi:bifunctional oligoribonuclease and PAP phosphatase NrnA